MSKPKQPQVRNRFTKRERVALVFNETGKTKPEFKDACDVRNIIDRYHRTGQVPLNTKNPLYGDFTTVRDFHTSMNIVIKAQEQFDSLPSQIRQKFNNDPSEFMEFMEDNNNSLEKLAEATGVEFSPVGVSRVQTEGGAQPPDSGDKPGQNKTDTE